MMSKMVINQSMPNISIGQPRDGSVVEASVVSHLHARWLLVNMQNILIMYVSVYVIYNCISKKINYNSGIIFN